jgi:hypothetical protein
MLSEKDKEEVKARYGTRIREAFLPLDDLVARMICDQDLKAFEFLYWVTAGWMAGAVEQLGAHHQESQSLH